MRFVIIAAPRTGSSHLVNTLSGHPEIFCHGNVFAKGMMPVFWPKSGRPSADEAKGEKDALRQLRDSDPDQFLEKVFSTAYGRQHVGFKIFEGQNDDVLDKLIGMPTVKKIVLFRKNVLANYASAVAAAQSGTWGIEKKDSDEHPVSPKIEFNAKSFSRFHAKYISYYRTIAEKLNNAGEVFWFCNYDEINDRQLVNGLIKFIGGDPSVPISEDDQRKQQVKLNSSDILSRFSNQRKVRDYIKKRDLLHWRYEGLTSMQDLPELKSKTLQA